MSESRNGAGPLHLPLESALGVRPDSAAMARALGLLYIGGPTVAVICLLLPHSPKTNEAAIWVMAAIAYAVLFFSRRHAALHLLYPAVAYAVVLAILAGRGDGAPGGSEAAYWLQAMAALAVTALLVASLSRALRENLRRVEEERRRRAMELNDDVVQRLVVARMSYASGRRDEADHAMDQALERARAIISEQLPLQAVAPGDLRRERRSG